MKIVNLQKVGNSKGVIIPSDILRFLGINNKVEIYLEGERIIIEKCKNNTVDKDVNCG